MDTRNITTIHWCQKAACENQNFTLCLGKKLGYIAALRTLDPLPEVYDLLAELLCLELPVPQNITNEIVLSVPNVRIDGETRELLNFWLCAETKQISVGCMSNQIIS